MTQPLFLVGARGCGKTTVGTALAQALGYQCVDTDHWLLENTGETVAQMVARDGWDSFRAKESRALQAVTAPQRVIATGGGMVLAEVNRRFMRENGTVIYLRAPAHILANRLEAFPEAGQRPTLTGRPITDEIVEILAAREALYRDVSHHVVDAARIPAQVVDDILSQLQFSHPA